MKSGGDINAVKSKFCDGLGKSNTKQCKEIYTQKDPCGGVAAAQKTACYVAYDTFIQSAVGSAGGTGTTPRIRAYRNIRDNKSFAYAGETKPANEQLARIPSLIAQAPAAPAPAAPAAVAAPVAPAAGGGGGGAEKPWVVGATYLLSPPSWGGLRAFGSDNDSDGFGGHFFQLALYGGWRPNRGLSVGGEVDIAQTHPKGESVRENENPTYVLSVGPYLQGEMDLKGALGGYLRGAVMYAQPVDDVQIATEGGYMDNPWFINHYLEGGLKVAKFVKLGLRGTFGFTYRRVPLEDFGGQAAAGLAQKQGRLRTLNLQLVLGGEF